jgi:predicted permease
LVIKKTKNKMAKTQNKKEPSFLVKMFMDKNDINEKSIVGFGSFIMMVIALGVDIVTGILGSEMMINEFIFDGFMVLTLGSFGIASVDKYFTGKSKKTEAEPTETEEEEIIG